jgi:hypothetical protein
MHANYLGRAADGFFGQLRMSHCIAGHFWMLCKPGSLASLQQRLAAAYVSWLPCRVTDSRATPYCCADCACVISWGYDAFSLKEATMGDVLQQVGYVTSHFGKW